MQSIDLSPWLDRLEHGLDREKPDRGRDRDQVRDAPRCLDLVFRGRTEPDVRPAVAPVGPEHAGDVLRALGQELPLERGGGADQVPEFGPPGLGRSVVEDVGHDGAEDAMSRAGGQGLPVPANRLPPVVKRGAHPLGARVPEVATLVVASSGAFGDRGGIAVVAGRAYAQAAKPRIEGGMSPSDQRRAHSREYPSWREMSGSILRLQQRAE